VNAVGIQVMNLRVAALAGLWDGAARHLSDLDYGRRAPVASSFNWASAFDTVQGRSNLSGGRRLWHLDGYCAELLPGGDIL
jgi:hypothetical protein